jgi:DNA-binding FrmR family transcriptional regulator
MLDNQVDCQGVLIQVSAVKAALNQFTIELLQYHLDSSVAAYAASGDKKALRQLQNVVVNILNS